MLNRRKQFTKTYKVNLFLKRFTANPALSITFSFVSAIVIGTVLIMLPISVASEPKIGLLNSLFTATSAVCVTGLTVVDTGMKFTLFGQVIILILIQIGGLGIMILSFFTAFIIGKKITLEEKMTLTFLINENDTKKISTQIKKIIFITFMVELIGTILLFFNLHQFINNPAKLIFFSLFHSVSAFCNAGFSLYSDNLMHFQSDIMINFIICILIIIGGISFSVLINVIHYIKVKIKKYWLKKEAVQLSLTLNTKVVLIITAVLILAGMLIIYRFEHRHLLNNDLKTQYLSVFFQSVTLRTAGFNTIDFTLLNQFTYLVMIFFMFIGGASGSTAGGIKVNTLGIIYAYTKSILKGERQTVLMKKSLSPGLINHSFLIIILYLMVIFSGTLIISFIENIDLIKILFEVVSAICTVGLSAGITASLSGFSKIIIIILMFLGRIGPLTILTALSIRTYDYEIKYPEENISIG